MRAAAIAVGFLDRQQPFGDLLAHQLRRAQQRLQPLDFGQQFFVFILDLFALQRGQPAQRHVQDCLGLDFRQLEALHQSRPGGFHVRRFADHVDHFIQVLQRHAQPFQDVGAGTGARQIELAPAADDFQPVFNVDSQRLLQAQQARLTFDQRQHDNAEGGLHRGVFVQVTQNLLWLGVLAQLDHDPHSLAVRFVAQVNDALNPFLTRQLGDALNQRGLVGHVGQFGDDDAVFAAFHLLQVGAGLHGYLAPAGAVSADQPIALGAVDDHTAGREIWPLHIIHQVFNADIVQVLPVIQQVAGCIHYLHQVVGRNAGGHADGNPGGAVDQQVWDG